MNYSISDLEKLFPGQWKDYSSINEVDFRLTNSNDDSMKYFIYDFIYKVPKIAIYMNVYLGYMNVSLEEAQRYYKKHFKLGNFL